ncbi:hypothetical protein FC43_GL001443 [Limosilactobacillus ingluviei DSM 15946]|uniref:Uncharacterized protein n=1 Tax=Limosilactobacillus ingluviei DSM 15946 TaxID=1423760 RepID=A0A0R1UKQ0_9LACO|nr:hypothetical protein FC43_GL001443 [Limosilactobacillus ingluviei DSM 15946]
MLLFLFLFYKIVTIFGSVLLTKQQKKAFFGLLNWLKFNFDLNYPDRLSLVGL